MVSLTEPQELKQATRIETKGGKWDYIIFHSFSTTVVHIIKYSLCEKPWSRGQDW